MPEFGYGECNGFVKRVCVYLDRVDDAISIGIRNPAARKSHRSNYIHVFAFISPLGLSTQFRHRLPAFRDSILRVRPFQVSWAKPIQWRKGALYMDTTKYIGM
ncbi:MAG: hypothetical protein WBW33_22295, partial [Bryobacteraceae bacterium]